MTAVPSGAQSWSRYCSKRPPSGAARVQADTTAGNAAALNVLRRLGFTLTRGRDGQDVHALISLAAPRSSAEYR